MKTNKDAKRMTCSGFFRMLGLVTVIGMAAGAVAETTHVLNTTKYSAAQKITSAIDWNTPDNWDAAGVPNSADSFAKLNASLPANTYAYVTSSVPVTLSRIGYEGASVSLYHQVYLSDQTLTLAGARKNNTAMYLYAPVAVGATIYTQYIDFCGPLSFAGGASILGNYYTTEFRYDRWADSVASERVNPCGTDGILALSGSTMAFFSPESSVSDVSATYKTTAGSPYVFRTAESARHVISVGTKVQGTDVDEDTFVKRIFPDDSIELSKPVRGNHGYLTLKFKAFTPSVRQGFAKIRQNGGDNITFKLNKYRAEDELVISTTNFEWAGNGNVTVNTDAGFVPGLFSTTRFMAPSEGSKCRLRLGKCELELNPFEGANDYVEGAKMEQINADAVTGIAVAEGNSVVITQFTNFVGRVMKRGAGRLTIAFSNGVSGALEVTDGILAPSFPPDTTLRSLVVAAGAEFVVPATGLVVSEANLASGAILSGGGTLTVIGGARTLNGVIFKDGTRIVFEYDPKGGEVIHDYPTWTTLPTRLRNQAAFWVDANDDASLETVEVDSNVYVTRVKDVRGESYGFATNAASYHPILKAMPRGANREILFRGNCSGIAGETKDITRTDSLVWKDPIYNIRFVFQVWERGLGSGGQYLGNTTRTGHGNDFVRAPSEPTQQKCLTVPIFYKSASAGVRLGTFRVLDKVWAATERGFAYLSEGADTLNKTSYPDRIMYAPLVTSLETAEPYPAADTFDYDCGGMGRFGQKGLCELIVFTNAVSVADRQAITAYLAKKWNNCEIVNFHPTNADGSTLGIADVTDHDLNLAVAAGGSMMVAGVTGDNEFVKSGAGTLFVPEYVNASGKLRVTEGTLELTAPTLSRDDLPANPYLHLDATAFGSDYTVVNGVTNLMAWSDVRGEGYPRATLLCPDSTQKPFVHTAALNGLPTIDFGEYNHETTTGGVAPNNSSGMGLAVTNGMHSVFAVWGSRNGGGSGILGCGGGAYNQGRGLTRGGSAYGASKDDPIIRSAAKYHYPGFGDDYVYASRFFLNGEAKDPAVVGFSGGYDILSLVTYNSFGMSALSSGGLYHQYYGGEEIGELIVYERALSEEEAKKVEAYLRKKWYGTETAGYRAPVADSVAVAAGATLSLRGNAPLTVSTLTGAGTVAGSVIGADAMELVVTVKEDGSVSKLTVTGDADLSAGCTIRFDGAVGKLVTGEFVILQTAGSLLVGELVVDTTGVKKSRFCSLKAYDGSLVLTVTKAGLAVIVR